jgi:hypothetical protein
MTNIIEFAQSKPLRTVSFTGTPELALDNGEQALIKATNERGPFEIVIMPETRGLIEEIITAPGGTLEGFFRRRSTGYRPDGTRSYLWAFFPTALAAEQEEAKLAA